MAPKENERRGVDQVVSDADITMSPDDAKKIAAENWRVPEGFDDRRYALLMVRKKDAGNLPKGWVLLVKGDARHPNIREEEWTTWGGKEVIVLEDCVLAYTLRETERNLVQARADAKVGALAKQSAFSEERRSAVGEPGKDAQLASVEQTAPVETLKIRR